MNKRVHLRYGSDLGQTRNDETGYTLCGRDNSTVDTISERAHDERRRANTCAVCGKAYDAKNSRR